MVKRRYENLDGVRNEHTFADMRKWRAERKAKVKDLTTPLPQAERKQTAEVRNNRSALSYTWIGHSTFFIQLDGLNILTDPVWAGRMGFQRRLTAPGWAISELPDIDVVVISHGHYDHLDFPTLARLPGQPAYFVPAGLGALFRRKGYWQVTEANWWECFEHQGIRLHFVPAQHWTRRSLWDMNTSHWGGWVLEGQRETLYFAGDTGYFRGFREIGSRFTIDTVFMPIGAYEPEWFMRISHINPEDAVQAYLDLDSREAVFVPMHYGAYRLADDTGPEALERLYSAWAQRQLPDQRLRVLAIGETCFKRA
ncbi:MBL fold metallo-hydrolase [Paenibacillus sp. y28]|uniref:MBL fold metallo-hydrolase n=1 Tax=Paenibacillus sp. y28 TaxID=3129110 RepID=UPI003016F3EA